MLLIHTAAAIGRFGDIKMKKTEKENRANKGIPLIFSIILVFCILGTVVFSVARRISVEMSSSAINNLSESLDLIKGTIEAIMVKEADGLRLQSQRQ